MREKGQADLPRLRDALQRQAIPLLYIDYDWYVGNRRVGVAREHIQNKTARGQLRN